MNELLRQALLAKLEENIRVRGMHVNLVKSRQVPRFAYTIGLLERGDFELVFAGGANLSDLEVKTVLDLCGTRAVPGLTIDAGTLGGFVLGPTSPSWREALLLGALQRYGAAQLNALQVIPVGRRTIDVPDLSLERSESGAPAWKYLSRPWDLELPETSHVITNLPALYGDPVTEVTRWEEDEFEAFAGAGPEVPPSDLRTVPISTMLARDPSLLKVVSLAIGKGLWRSGAADPWVSWG